LLTNTLFLPDFALLVPHNLVIIAPLSVLQSNQVLIESLNGIRGCAMRLKWIGWCCLALGLIACEQQPSSENGVALGEPTLSQHQSLSPPQLASSDRKRLQQDYATTSFKVLRIGEQEFDGGPALAVTFSVPLDPQLNWSQYLELSNRQGDSIKGDWILSDRLNTLYFPFIEAETQYQITVRAGLPAINDRLLKQAVTQKITTSPLKKQVRFTSVGSQLSPQLSDGLTVEAINVKAVDVDFHRVDSAHLHQFVTTRLSDSYYDLQQLGQYASLVHSVRYDLNYAPNKKRQSLLPISQLDALKTPGVYIAVMKAAGDYPYTYQVTDKNLRFVLI
jgi:hypothetical protein